MLARSRYCLSFIQRSRLQISSLRQFGAHAHDHDDDHHHGPNLPPFARQRPPTKKLPLEVENVWDDSVAPESAIDFDAPHVSITEIFFAWGMAGLFFFSLYKFIEYSEPEKRNPAVSRLAVLDDVEFKYDFGLISKEKYEELLANRSNDHDDDDDDHDE